MRSDLIAKVASVAIVAGGVALVFVHYYAGSPGDPEGWFSAIGFAAPYIGAGLVALVGTLRKRAALMLAAGVAVIPMSVLSIVLIPLLIPAVVLVIQAGKVGVNPSSLVLPAVLAAGLVGALAVVVFHQDPAQWSTPDGGGGSSNIVTTTESVIAIATAVTVNLIAALIPDETKPLPEAQSGSIR